jgi:ubiquinone/menaquinone biosynthesis C-methylase UbiE
VEKPPGSMDGVMMHSILHLIPDVPGVLHKVQKMLKSGGVLVTSTACVGEIPWYWQRMIKTASFLRLGPYINYFTQEQLERWIVESGFTLDHVWRPNKNAAAFIIARMP